MSNKVYNIFNRLKKHKTFNSIYQLKQNYNRYQWRRVVFFLGGAEKKIPYFKTFI